MAEDTETIPEDLKGLDLTVEQIHKIQGVRSEVKDLRERLSDPTDFNTVEDFRIVLLGALDKLHLLKKDPLP
jgi:hypothetical protein